MTEKPRDKPSILVRGAVLAGQMAGAWRQRQRALAQDAFVLQWKEAWVQGCETAWAGQPPALPSGLNESQRAAWTAGWRWAQTQPDRRHPSSEPWVRNGRRRADVPRLVRAAKGGAAGLVVFAATRWLMVRSRTGTKRRPQSPPPPGTPPDGRPSK